MAPFTVDYIEGADVGYRWYQLKAQQPLFPFGHGLSYTRFGYAGLRIEDGPMLKISFDVTNTGGRAGVDVPQVYVQPPGAGNMRRLAGWSRVQLSPGQTRRVTVTVDRRVIARFDGNQPGWIVAGGKYDVTVGRFAGDRALGGVAQVAAARLPQ